MPLLTGIILYLEVTDLRSVINATKIILSIVITVFTVVLESKFYKIVLQPNISSRKIT